LAHHAEAVQTSRQALAGQSYGDLVADAKAAIRALRERFERTGSLIV